MIEYTEQAVMVDALRYCAQSGNCPACPRFDSHVFWHDCDPGLKQAAADIIEALYAKTQEQQKIIDEQDEEIAALQREIMSYPSEEAGT